MTDKERLEKINELLGKYYDSEDSFEQTDLAISIIQGHVDWLIEQAEKVEAYEKELDRLYATRYSEVSDIAKETFGLND